MPNKKWQNKKEKRRNQHTRVQEEPVNEEKPTSEISEIKTHPIEESPRHGSMEIEENQVEAEKIEEPAEPLNQEVAEPEALEEDTHSVEEPPRHGSMEASSQEEENQVEEPPRHGSMEASSQEEENQVEEPVEPINQDTVYPEVSQEQAVVNKPQPSSHTEALNDLVKEVQIFSDDDEFFLPQKKSKAWIFILLLFLLLIGAGLYYYFAIYSKDEQPKEEKKEEETIVDSNYSYEEKEDSIDFLKGPEVFDSYLCKKNCSIYSLGRYQYHENGVIAIQDGEDIFLYDYVHQKKITDDFLSLKNLVKEGKTVAFLAEKEEGFGVISTDGKEIIPFEYEDMAYSFGGGDVTDYSYDKMIITANKEGKWGLISLDDGQELIPFEYEDIYYSGYDAVAVQKEGSWRLLDLMGKELFQESYDMIIPLKSFVFIAKNKQFNILNYQEEAQLKDVVPTYVTGFRGRVTSQVPTFKVELDGTVVTIYIMENAEDENAYSTYKFNTVNGEFTKVMS